MTKKILFVALVFVPALTVRAQNICTTSTISTQSVATRLNSAISACLVMGGGIVDARMLVPGSGGGIDAEVAVGNAAGTPITLLLPVIATWTISIKDNTKCGIRVYPRGSVIGQDSGNGLMLIDTATGSLVKAEICIDGAGSSGSIRLEAFQLMNR